MKENPYSIPDSEVFVDVSVKRSVFWKTYFFIVNIFMVLGYMGLLAREGAGFSEIVGIPLWVLITIGLFGYAFSKKIFIRQFWFPVLLTELIYSVYYFITDLDLFGSRSAVDIIINQGVGWLITIPAFLGVFLYSRPTYPRSGKKLQRIGICYDIMGVVIHRIL